MNFLHYEFELNADDVVEVTLDKQANVRLLDPANYAAYERGAAHRYFGGLAKVSPVQIAAPRPGHWHLVIDLGGFAGTVHAAVQVPQSAA